MWIPMTGKKRMMDFFVLTANNHKQKLAIGRQLNLSSETPWGYLGLVGGTVKGRNTMSFRFSHQHKLLTDAHLEARNHQAYSPCRFLTCSVSICSILLVFSVEIIVQCYKKLFPCQRMAIQTPHISLQNLYFFLFHPIFSKTNGLH